MPAGQGAVVERVKVAAAWIALILAVLIALAFLIGLGFEAVHWLAHTQDGAG